MAVIHISEADATRDLASLLAHVRSGAEVVIEDALEPIAVIQTPGPIRRSIENCVALLSADSTAIMDENFAQDVEAGIKAHRESLDPPVWE